MPKRIVDGEGVWRSDKVAQVQPPNWRAEFANLIPLALANGTFEAVPRRIWSTVYSYNRPDVTPEIVEQILAEFERVKLLFRWTDAATGKMWGFWVGIDKPGRLPGESRRGRNEAVGLTPPVDQLRKFLASNGIQSLPLGNGKLLGSGSGKGFKCAWDGSEGKALDSLLSSNPAWTENQIAMMVRNRFGSEGVNSARPRKWLPNLSDYAAGLLDRYGKLSGRDGNVTNRAEREEQQTHDAIAGAAQRFVTRHSTGEVNGVGKGDVVETTSD